MVVVGAGFLVTCGAYVVEVVLADRALLLARLRALAVLGANTRRPLPLAGVHDAHDPGGADVVQQAAELLACRWY